MAKTLSIVSHKNYNLYANRGLWNVFDFQVNYMLYWQLHSEKRKSQSIAYLLNGSEHIYWILDLDNEVHSIRVICTSGLQESKGHARVRGPRSAQAMVGFFRCCPYLPSWRMQCSLGVFRETHTGSAFNKEGRAYKLLVPDIFVHLMSKRTHMVHRWSSHPMYVVGIWGLSYSRKVEKILSWAGHTELRCELHQWTGRTGSWLQMNRLSLRNSRLKFKTAG